MKYECAIWDWNGTLLDDVNLSVEVFNSMLERWFGTSITVEEYKGKFRFPVEDFYKDYGFDFSKQDFDEVGRHFIKTYNARRFECPLHKGAEAAMMPRRRPHPKRPAPMLPTLPNRASKRMRSFFWLAKTTR